MCVERRKLFSSSKNSRRRLFSGLNEGGVTAVEEIKKLQCRDCGYIMETLATTTDMLCPKCGAVNRFNVLELTPSPANTPEAVQVEVSKVEEVEKEPENKTFSRRSLFGREDEALQKEFSEPSNELEERLKEFSGKTFEYSEVEKTFGIPAEELIEKGFASINDEDKVSIGEDAFLQSKLFSKLIVSVTKILDLDNDVMSRPKEDIISMLEEKESLSPKGIMLIKKAHALPMVEKEVEFSSTEETESWLKDSGIIGDLKIEFGNSAMGIKEFTKILEERYDDAPENIIDILIEKGVIKIQGNQVDIMK